MLLTVLPGAINPENLLLIVGAAAAIAQTGASTGSQAVALIVFIVIATLGVGAPVAIYYLAGDRATRILGGLHDWMPARTRRSWLSSVGSSARS